jgi:hypothetical protein
MAIWYGIGIAIWHGMTSHGGVGLYVMASHADRVNLAL